MLSDSKFLIELTLNILSISCPVLIIYSTNSVLSMTEIFYWHPVMMSLSFFFTMIQAAMILVADKSIVGLLPSAGNRASKIFLHTVIQSLSVTLYAAGFAFIFANKWLKGKNHFTTYHGMFGLVTLVLGAISNFLLGLILYFECKNFVEKFGLKLLQVKKAHRWSSLAVFVFGMLTILLSLASDFVSSAFSFNSRAIICLSIIVVIPLFSMTATRFTVKDIMKLISPKETSVSSSNNAV